jgi:hypothetical protein
MHATRISFGSSCAYMCLVDVVPYVGRDAVMCLAYCMMSFAADAAERKHYLTDRSLDRHKRKEVFCCEECYGTVVKESNIIRNTKRLELKLLAANLLKAYLFRVGDPKDIEERFKSQPLRLGC